MEATHLVINHLRNRAHGAPALRRLNISPAAVRCLLQNWSTAEEAGVRFHSWGVVVGGVDFRVRGELQPEISAALRWRRAATAADSLAPAASVLGFFRNLQAAKGTRPVEQ